MKIVLFGSPEFSIPTFNKIYNSHHQILSVYTKPAKEQGRGMKPKNTPLYEVVKDYNIPINTPKSLKKTNELEKLKNFNADIFVVVAYGLILPKEMLNYAKYGCINIHPSLLPRWRGAAPLQRAIMEGDKKTGVCIIVLGEGLDDGDIIKKQEYEITKNTTLEILHNDLAVIGADLMLETLNDIEKNQKIIATPQSEIGLTYAKKIENEEAQINFDNSVEKIDCLIRALSSTVGTYFIYKCNIDNTIIKQRIKILKADIEKTDKYTNIKNGDIVDKKHFYIKCDNGILKPLILQKEGKKPLEVNEFVRGFKF